MFSIMKYNILLFFFLLLPISFVFSQKKINITFSVQDLTSLQSIYGARVFNAKGGKYIGLTNPNGELSLRKIPNHIIITHPKYIDRKISKQELKNSNFKIYLTEKTITHDELVISATRIPEFKKDISQKIELIKSGDIENLNQSSTADLLSSNGSVLVQKSQQGGGSPIIRGFETNKVLIVVDGVRMNNAIYRGGHLQNVITLDNAILDRVEVLYGPGSVIYGSDALGGVMSFYTKSPKFSQIDGDVKTNASFYSRYFSAANGYSLHADCSVGSKKIASLTSISYNKFGNLKQGRNRSPFLQDFGSRNWFVRHISGVDSVLSNPDPDVQIGSAYDQIDFLQKINIKQSSEIFHSFNFQFSTSGDIPRYDRLTLLNNNSPKFAEWHYGPQQRLLASYTLIVNRDIYNKSKLFDYLKLVTAYQNIEESRITRKFQNALRENRIEKLNIYTFNLNFFKKLNKNELNYGIEAFNNDVTSNAFSKNIFNDSIFNLDTRYPDGGSSMFSSAIFIANSYEHSKKLIFHQGIRYSYTNLNAKFIDQTFFPFPYNSINQNNSAVNGSLGLVYSPFKKENVRFLLNIGSGFRAPNVDDLSKVFESVPGNLLIPNPNLKNEYSYTGEIGADYHMTTNMVFSLHSYFTLLNNAITVQTSQFNGSDSIFYNDEMSRVMMTVNKGTAYIYGVESKLRGNITPSLSVLASFNYTYGRIVTDTTPYPLDHIPPIFGKLSMQYSANRFKGEFFVNYSGWKSLEDYNLVGEDNYLYATQYGMPSWYTLNLRMSFTLNKYLNFQLAVENILDKNYRVFASNISAPGRNIILTLRSTIN